MGKRSCASPFATGVAGVALAEGKAGSLIDERIWKLRGDARIASRHRSRGVTVTGSTGHVEQDLALRKAAAAHSTSFLLTGAGRCDSYTPHRPGNPFGSTQQCKA